MRKEELLKVEVLEEVEAPASDFVQGIVAGVGIGLGIVALT